MFEKRINVLAKSSNSITKRTLRQFKGVSRMTEIEYEKARLEYNREVTRRKNAIKTIKQSFDTQLQNNLDNGFTFDLSPVKNNYNNILEFLKYMITQVRRTKPDKKVLMSIGGEYYTLSDNNSQRLLNAIEQVIMEEEEVGGSDGIVIQRIIDADTASFKLVKDKFKKKNGNGTFFPYFNKTKYDLSRYGIFQTVQPKYTICFLEALEAGGLCEEKINQLKGMIRDSRVPICKINQICEDLRIRIKLRTIRSGGKQSGEIRVENYGKEGPEYHLCLYEEHYFIYETTKNTRYSLEHYDEIKDHPRANEIYIKEGKKYKYKIDRYINSCDLFRILLDNVGTLIEKMSYDDITHTPYYKHTNNDEITTLQYDESFMLPIENNVIDTQRKSLEKKFINVYADFETVTEGAHKPYLCSMIFGNASPKTFIGEDCAKKMLNYLSACNFDNVRLIFHNATYDFRFLLKHLSQLKYLPKGTHFINASGKYFNMEVEIKCSYNLITSPLRDFGSMFQLKQEKEVMPYHIYTNENIEKRYIDINEATKYLKVKERSRFVDNIEKWSLRRQDGTFDIIEYSRHYCEMDCIVLKQGYEKFRGWIMDLEYINSGGVPTKCGLDIDVILTSAGLAHRYMIMSGCYEGVYSLCGVPQRFIQKTVVGGRTMMRNNKKDYINRPKLIKSLKLNKRLKLFRKIADFDGVSLYPSAMKRMPGFLKGKPKILDTTDYNIIKNYDGYFIEVNIHNIPIKRSFPLISRVNENGVRIFSNDIRGNVYLDKIQFEDLIQFHGLTEKDFTIVRGYYFNEGFNNKINTAITYLFETRKKLKSESNPAETIYKLIMNSAYGKTIMKEVDTAIQLYDTSTEKGLHDYDVYVSRNFEWIQQITPIYGSDKVIIKSTKPINLHYNVAQVGSSVLSWSKRIMNEVICLAEDNNIEIFYQDTDSLHMYEQFVNKLGDLFKTKYDRELIGEELGQFHTDFAIKYEDENGIKRKCKNVYSRRLITLGKKCYIDELVGTDHNGKERIEYHIRMKGVSNDAIEYAVEQKGYQSPIELYEDLYNGEKIEFDLCCGGNKPVFEKNRNLSITSKSSFIRELQF